MYGLDDLMDLRRRTRIAITLFVFYGLYTVVIGHVPVGSYWETTWFYDIVYFLLPAATLVVLSGEWRAVLPGAIATGVTQGVVYHNLMYFSDSYSFYTLVEAGGTPYFLNVFWYPMTAFLVVGLYIFWTGRTPRFDYRRGFFLLAGNLAVMGVFIAQRDAIVSLLDFPAPYFSFISTLLLGSVLVLASQVPRHRLSPILRVAVLAFIPLMLYLYIGLTHYQGWVYDGGYLYMVPVLHTAIPLEEFLNWGILYPVWAMVLFEWLSKDNRDG